MNAASVRELPLIAFALFAICAFAASIAIGTETIPLSETWRVFWHPDGSRVSEIVWELRVPRTMLAMIVAIALGVGGALMQSVTRNPLADPGLLGVNAGAAAAIVVGIIWLGAVSPLSFTLLGFGGAIIALILVHTIGGRGGASTPVRLVLTGTAVSAALTALVTGLTLLHAASFDALRAWEVGSLAGRGHEAVPLAGVLVVVATLIGFGLARALNALALGDESGAALGVPVTATRISAFVAIALLCGTATAVAGPIGFIGLTVPHLARLLVGPDHRRLLAASMLIAPCLLLPADVLGRVLSRPSEVQVGVIVALLGAPVLIAIVRSRRVGALAVAGSTPIGGVRRTVRGTRLRHGLALIALLALALVVLIVAVGTGERAIGPGRVVQALFGQADAATEFVVGTLRLPRSLTALLVGAALGLSGGVFQSLTRNPLGSPDVIGFTWGAAAGAVIQILLFDGGALAISLSAIGGGIVTAAIVYALAFGRSSAAAAGSASARMILIGIAVSALLAALVAFMLAAADRGAAQSARIWLTGSLNGRGFEHVWSLVIAFGLLIPMVVLLARSLRMLELGDDAAAAIGVSVGRARALLIFVAVALSGVATAAAGPMPFVALAAPQLARRVTGASGPGLLGAAAMGGLLLAASDLAAQRLLPTGGLPVGVMTGSLGGLYLLWLLNREMTRR